MKNLKQYIKEKLFHQQVDEKLIVNKDYKTTYDDSEVLRIFKDEIAASDVKHKYFMDSYKNTWKSNMPSALWVTVRNDFLSHPFSYQLNNNDAETLFKYLVEFDAIYEFRFNPRIYSSNGDELIDLYAAALDVKNPDETDVKNVNIKAFKFDDIAIVKAADKTNGECRMFVAINVKSLHEKLVVSPSHVSEKLVINKNYNVTDYNAKFYTTFKRDFEELTNNLWFTQFKHVPVITSPHITEKQQIQIYNDFDEVVGNKKGYHVWGATFGGHNIDRKLLIWLNMMKWIFEHENGMTFKISEDFDNDCHFIREFETDKWIMCLVGPERVTNMSENGQLFFAWK